MTERDTLTMTTKLRIERMGPGKLIVVDGDAWTGPFASADLLADYVRLAALEYEEDGDTQEAERWDQLYAEVVNPHPED